jgi:hypothetical protein
MNEDVIIDRLAQYVYARFRNERNRARQTARAYHAEHAAINKEEYAAESMLRLCIGDVRAGELASLAWARGQYREGENWQELLRQRAMNEN